MRTTFRRAAKSRSLSLLVGIGVVVLFTASVVFAYQAQNGIPFATVTQVRAAFDEVGSLRVGDDVRIASARVGVVEAIEYSAENGAVALLELDGERTIFRNATATTASVGARSALGQKFVNLDPGTPDAGELGPGEILPKSSTRGAQEITELFNVFDEKTRVAAGETLRDLGGGLQGRSQDLRDAFETAPELLPDLGTVSRALATDDGAGLVGVLESAEALASRFTGREQQIASLLTNLSATFDAVAVDGAEPFERTLEAAPDTLVEARAALDALRAPLADTRVAATDLRPGASALGAATPDLRGVFRDAVGPLDRVPGVADQAEPAVADLTDLSADLRPLTPRLVQTLRESAPLLADVAPFSPEIAHFFTNAASALSGGDAAGNWLRIVPMLSPESLSGSVPVEDPTVVRNGDPEPGELETDERPLPLLGGNR